MKRFKQCQYKKYTFQHSSPHCAIYCSPIQKAPNGFAFRGIAQLVPKARVHLAMRTMIDCAWLSQRGWFVIMMSTSRFKELYEDAHLAKE